MKVKEGYTVEEIQDWFLNGEHNKRMARPLERYENAENIPDYMLDKISGIFLSAHNTIIVLHRGQLHNPLGPAKVIVTKEGKPFHSIFARDGKIIKWDGFEAKIRGMQIKKKIEE